MSDLPDFSTESLIPFSIDLKFSETGVFLASATAFFYKEDDCFYLITNWHCFTGLDPRTKKQIGSHAGRPDTVIYRLYSRNGDEYNFNYFEAKLYHDQTMESPKWLVHPKFKQQVDVVALEIEIPHGFNCIPANDSLLKFDEIKARVADDVFILGFPYNIKQNGVFPIWKRASISTEPDFDYENLPIILVDTASRTGMSGSPVMLRQKGIYAKEGGLASLKQCFLGVYSGRILGKTELEAQLGIVWKKEVICEIINGRLVDELKNFH
jgi:hypothetical protein